MQIEDTQQNQSGWLFTRGAFDKGDLLYLRDEEEKRRFQEVELRDSERSQASIAIPKTSEGWQASSMLVGFLPLASNFLKARAKIEADQAAAVQRRAEAARRERASRPQKGLLGVVKVKAVNATDSTGLPGAQQPPAKKQKLDDSSAQAAGSQAAAEPREAPAARSPAAADDAGSSEEGGLAGLLGGYASDSDEDAVAVGSRETDSRQTENG
eukprot:jgi/Astpho2/4360/Aster-x0627